MISRRNVFNGFLCTTLIAVSSTSSADAEEGFRRRTYRQSTRSMLPTIEPGDRIKVLLGPVKVGDSASAAIKLERGDLVAFTTPLWGSSVVIFRLIGLPSETISMREETVAINGVPVLREPAGKAPDNPSYYFDNPAPGPWPELQYARFVRETLSNGTSYKTLHMIGGESVNDTYFKDRNGNFPPTTIPEDQVFLLGDSRDNANDSRFKLGLVPMKQIIGKVVPPRR